MAEPNPKVAFVAGGTGATGKLLMRELLRRGYEVRTVVRGADRLPEDVREHANVRVREAALLDLSDAELQEQVRGCGVIASCLGHNISFRGMYLHPRKLCTDAVRRLTNAATEAAPTTSKQRVKFLLMNTVGVHNMALEEQKRASWGHWALLGLVRVAVPPMSDNEGAAYYLPRVIGSRHPLLDWVTVRPDSLVDEEKPTPWEIEQSPLTDCLFAPRTTSRINVAHFMAALADDEGGVFARWKFQMPVIYNRLAPSAAAAAAAK